MREPGEVYGWRRVGRGGKYESKSWRGGGDGKGKGKGSEEKVAAEVCVSSRTLQRRLAEEGTSFRKLVLEVRRQLAEKYISDKAMPLAEISYMQGFADTSSFSRAFKKWTGDPPAIFRSNLKK